jgi:hypothetical protein
MSDAEHDVDQLRKLERWRTLELEHAQVEHAHAASVADQKKLLVERVQSAIDETRKFAREQRASSRMLSPDALRRINEFSVLQSQQLDAAETAWRQSLQHCETALRQVVDRFEDVSVIERLRERRQIEAGRATARRELKRLDEHALAHLAAADSTTTANERE